MMGGMTITEFLLARIAEDGAWAAARERWRSETLPGDTAVARRLRKECEAKRRIVDTYRRSDDFKQAHGGDAHASETWSTLHYVVLSLAGVYADHSDFDEEWRA